MLFTVETLKILEEERVKPNKIHLDPSAFELLDNSGWRHSVTRVTVFTVGESYSLMNMSCKGFEPKRKTFKVVGLAESLHGVPIESLIVKQVGGEVGRQFTLTEDDCALYGVPFEEGLILLPKDIEWRPSIKYEKFDPNNLATTPVNPNDGMIHIFILRIHPFENLPNGYVMSPTGKVVKAETIERTINIFTKQTIVLADGTVIKEGTKLNSEIITPSINGIIYKYGNFIASDGAIYICVTVDRNSDDVGIRPDYVDGIDPHEFFDIRWDETKAMTTEEFSNRIKTRIESISRQEEYSSKAVDRAEKMIDESMSAMLEHMEMVDKHIMSMISKHEGAFKNIVRKKIDERFNELESSNFWQ